LVRLPDFCVIWVVVNNYLSSRAIARDLQAAMAILLCRFLPLAQRFGVEMAEALWRYLNEVKRKSNVAGLLCWTA